MENTNTKKAWITPELLEENLTETEGKNPGPSETTPTTFSPLAPS